MMKKLFLLSILAPCTMTMSAQIALEHTFDGSFIQVPETVKVEQIAKVYNEIPGYITCDSSSLKIYSDDFSLEKSLTFDSVYMVSKDICSTDGEITFIVAKKGKNDQYKPFTSVKLYNEDGQVLFDFGSIQWFDIVKVGNNYKMLIADYTMEVNPSLFRYEHKNCKSYVYSLPGNGQPTDLEAPTAPARTSNARKVVENGQMYIILDGVKYAVKGTEM